MNYDQYLRTEYWRKVSAEVKRRAGYRCQVCNSSENLVAHHRTYANRGREMEHLNDLVCLCRTCHEGFHKVEEVNGKRVATRMPDAPRHTPIQATQRQANADCVAQQYPSRKERRRQMRELAAHQRFLKRKAREEHRIRIMQQQLKSKQNQTKPEPKPAKVKSPPPVRHDAFFEEVKKTAASLYNHDADMPSSFPAIIDKDLADKFRTKAGGFTSKTINALGVERPLKSGWIDRLIGTQITEQRCRDALVGRECKSTVKSLGLYAKINESLKEQGNV